MALRFFSSIDRDVLSRAADAVAGLVAAPQVGAAWQQGSVLAGMSVGGLTRHLVSQVECAVEFLRIQPPPPQAAALSLAELYRRTDWFAAPVHAVENTSICEGFNAMAAGGQRHSVAILEQARGELPEAAAAAGALTYVPWQDCTVTTEDFLVVRLMEVVVHADDLAVSVGLATPAFDDEITHPVVALLGVLSAQQHGSLATVRTLARAERAHGPTSAFEPPSR